MTWLEWAGIVLLALIGIDFLLAGFGLPSSPLHNTQDLGLAILGLALVHGGKKKA